MYQRLTTIGLAVLVLFAFRCDRPLDCGEVLPRVIDSHYTTETSCVRIDRTEVTMGATLTIPPATRVEFLEDGYLSVNTDNSGAALVADAGGSAFITFGSSKQLASAPGDWQCVRIAHDSPGTRIVNAHFEFGGQACEATGARPGGLLVLNGEIGQLSESTFLSSASHGLYFERDGRVRGGVTESKFLHNAQTGVRMGFNNVLSLGAGNTYLPADDYVHVDTSINSLSESGDWTAQSVPYRLLRHPTTGFLQARIDNAEVAIGPGTHIQLDNGSLEALVATLHVRGTREHPVRFTSAEVEPEPAHWGCLKLDTSPSGAPSSIQFAEIVGAGSGEQCTGARYRTGVLADPSTNIINTIFSDVDGTISTGSSIRTLAACPSADIPGSLPWCGRGNDFAEGLPHIVCGPLDGEVRNCVGDE